MSSALDARPRLRDDLTIVRREHDGRVHYVVKEPDHQKYFRFGETEVTLMRAMDGQRTPAEIAEAAEPHLGVLPPAGQVADFAHKLKRLGLVQRTPAEKHLMLMERLRSQRKVRANRRTRGSILRLRFSVGDPDRLFDWIVQRFPWLWSRTFVGISLALFAAYVIITVMRWDEFWAGTAGLYLLRGFTLWDWVLMYVLSITIVAFHEFGHGLTTKYFGGEVHEIGAMLIYFSPALYCNTNDAWTFEKRAHRLWVTFAGPWVQLFLTAIAAVVWAFTETGTTVNHLAFLAVLIGGASTLLANLNPLIPLDGYYALSDWLEVPNLRRRSFTYWAWMGKHFVLGIDAPEPSVTPRERRIFLLYGGLALVYSVFIAVVSAFWLIFIFGRLLGPWIWVIVAIIAARLVLRLGGRWQTLGLAAATTWRSGFLRGQRAAYLLAGTVLVIGLPFILPWTFRAQGDFVVEDTRRLVVRSEVAGVLDAIHARSGDTLEAGDPIATLWNPDLQAAVLDYRARARQLAVSSAAATAQGDHSAAAAAAAKLEEVRAELAILESQGARLEVRAPADGILLSYRLHERHGEYVQQGDPLARIASLQGRRARVLLPLTEAGEVAAGQMASLKLSARPGLKYRAPVATVAPAAEDGTLQAIIPLPTHGWQPDPGMVGTAKIETRRGTIAQAITRTVRQTLRLDLWL